MLTKGFAVHVPDDLKHKNTYYYSGDPIGPVLYSLIGDVTPRQLGVPEILPGLTSGSINVVIAPALAAEQLQWAMAALPGAFVQLRIEAQARSSASPPASPGSSSPVRASATN